MKWKIIEENKRDFADESYYLKAERNCSKGLLVLEICWAQFMYSLSVELFSTNTDYKRFFKKTKRETMYHTLVFYNDRIEKYGHQVMRMTDDSPIKKLKKLNSLQKDGALNYILSEKFKVRFETTLPEKKKEK
jgi:hypothetical protein